MKAITLREVMTRRASPPTAAELVHHIDKPNRRRPVCQMYDMSVAVVLVAGLCCELVFVGAVALSLVGGGR